MMAAMNKSTGIVGQVVGGQVVGGWGGVEPWKLVEPWRWSAVELHQLHRRVGSWELGVGNLGVGSLELGCGIIGWNGTYVRFSGWRKHQEAARENFFSCDDVGRGFGVWHRHHTHHQPHSKQQTASKQQASQTQNTEHRTQWSLEHSQEHWDRSRASSWGCLPTGGRQTRGSQWWGWMQQERQR